MFDMLTADELAVLHSKLCHAHLNVHYKMLDRDTGQPVIPVFSDDWQILSAHADEMNEMAAAVYAELTRREQEARADA